MAIKSDRSAFTIMEVLIVISIISLLVVGTLALINPMKQISKARDARRKQELEVLKKSLEEYYNDHGCYPKPSELCYDSPIPTCNKNGCGSHCTIRGQICHICGTENNSPSFSPYLAQLPCDPQHAKKQYLYEVQANPDNSIECSSAIDPTHSCPSWYRIYSDMDDYDSQARDYHCEFKGCGLAPNTLPASVVVSPYPYGYGFGVSSQNVNLESYSPPVCYDGHVCNVCAPQVPGEPPKSIYDCMAAPGNCIKFYTSWLACYCDNPGTGACP